MNKKLRSLVLSVVLVLSVFAGTVIFTDAVAAATNTSITPDDDDAGATNVTYTADGNVELANQDTLQYVDVHLYPANVSSVGTADIDVFIDGNEYTDGFTEFSASNGTVEFKLSNSQSVSDGDAVRIVVADVTNPSDDFDANATLHDTGDDKWQTYSDTVAIDTPPDISYHDLRFDDGQATGTDTTIDVNENLTVSATINNSGEQTGTYNASLEIDGEIKRFNNGTIDGNTEKTTSFVTNFSSPGEHNITIADLNVTEVTVTGPLEITGGSATPDTVTPGTTVDNQRVYVTVANVSQDGDTDTHYVEFPNTLVSGLSVNSVDANATSITSSPNLVDGYDNDGTTDTVKFATSGDGGGDIALNLTVDTTVEYPDTVTTYAVDARVEDSGGDVAEQSGVAMIDAVDSTAPTITNYSVTNPAERDIVVSFDSDEDLTNITAEVTDSSDTVIATLSESDFSETSSGETLSYESTYTAASDGDYTVTLTEATDANNNDGASGESGTVSIDVAAPEDDTSGGGGDSDSYAGGGDTAPAITDFELESTDQDLDLIVNTTNSVETLTVGIAGPVDTTLTRSDFAVRQHEETFTYSANVSSDVSGSFVATVQAVANDGPSGTADITDTATVPLPGEVESGAVAASPWAGETESTHIVTVPLPTDASITEETLSTVAIQYGSEFGAADGNLSAVDDGQSLVTVHVVTAAGTTQMRMRGSDAVSVNATTNAVQLDFSEVDSSRAPTLSGGDRVIIRMHPVVNPDEAGSYEATVTLTSASGTTEEITATTHIQSQSTVNAAAATFVTPADERVSVELTRSSTIDSVTVASEADAGGAVHVVIPDETPSVASSLSRPVVTTMKITRPDATLDDPATLTVALPRESFGGDAEALTLARYDRHSQNWVRLETQVTSTSNRFVTVQATSAETSLFALTAAEKLEQQRTQQAQDTQPQTTSAEADSRTSTPTETSILEPGFGILIAVLALVGAALGLAWRRR